LKAQETAMGLSERGHGKEGGISNDLNLLPVMAINCILIPLMLYAFLMFEVAVQPISLPKFGGSSGGGPKMLNLAVIVAADQFVIKIQGGAEAREIPLKKKSYTMCGEGTKTCEDCIGKDLEMYDYPGLYNEIVKLKASSDFEMADTINIGAGDAVPWKVLARTIDAVRVKLEEDKYDNLCLYERAKPLKITTTGEDGKEVKTTVPLFPKIVFVML